MQLRIIRWLSNFNFRELSHIDGSLTKLVKKHCLKNNDAIVVTSLGWHRLRIIARMGDRAVMIVPETHDTVLKTLIEWACASLRDGVVVLSEWRKLQTKAA